MDAEPCRNKFTSPINDDISRDEATTNIHACPTHTKSSG